MLTRLKILAAAVVALSPCLAANAAPAVRGTVAPDGSLLLEAGRRELGSIVIGAFDKNWQMTEATEDRETPHPQDAPAAERAFLIRLPAGPKIDGRALIQGDAGAAQASYRFVPCGDIALNGLFVSFDVPLVVAGGGTWAIQHPGGEQSGSFPATAGGMSLFNGPITKIAIRPPGGPAMTLSFPQPVQALIQDNRQWQSETFSIRLGPQGDALPFRKGETTTIAFSLEIEGGLEIEKDEPVTLTAGSDWIPLQPDLDIAAGSALDLSGQGFHDAPAGKHGRVIATPEGRFAFEDDPATPRRFYGVNFCFGALFVSHDQADRLAGRLQRLGYNAVRVHHHESELVAGQKDSLTLNPEKLDQLDYFLDACARRGIYATTDLFVSRPVPWKELGIDREGCVEMDTFKTLIPVVPAAWENWKAFARALLGHENPYRKLRHADDPALAWLAMVNEGIYANFIPRLRDIPEWRAAWNRWLAGRYPSREKLRAAWDGKLADGEDPARGTVAFPDSVWTGSTRAGDAFQFFAELERDTMRRMRAFIRDELRCRALLTNANAWTNLLGLQAARNAYDYVDDHFYVDHPEFIEKPWHLPSRSPNRSPVQSGAPGGRPNCFTRIPGRPFTITEFNYAAPSRCRGVGGILTGALGALQDWDGIWRFTYSHDRQNLFAPGALGFFDMACDPLGQAAERAAICLFLRGDMRPAPGALTIVTTEDEAFSLRPQPQIAPRWDWMAWVTRVGVIAARNPQDLPSAGIALAAGPASLELLGPQAAARAPAYGIDETALLGLLRARGVLRDGNPTAPAMRMLQSQTGEITIDGGRDIMILDTPRTAGGWAPAGERIAPLGGKLDIGVRGADAAAWVSSLDGQPIASSTRMLASHLTDLQNTGIRYAEKARQTLLGWGGLPHLVRNGQATFSLKHHRASELRVWALSIGGKRLTELPATRGGGTLTFTAEVAALPEHGAILLYEIGI